MQSTFHIINKVAKWIFTLGTFYFINFQLIAQQRKIDSLKILLKTEKEDTNKVNTLNKLSNAYEITSYYAKADSLARISLLLAQKIGFKKGEGSAFNMIGIIYNDQDNYPEALKNELQALIIFNENGIKYGISTSCNNIGHTYYCQGNFTEAMKYYIKALQLDKETGNKTGICLSYGNMGLIYDQQGNFPEALKNYSLALKLSEEIGNKRGISSGFGNIGSVYFEQGNYPEALKYYLQSLKTDEELGDKAGMINEYNNIGLIYAAQKNYPDALNIYFKALQIGKEIGYRQNMGAVYGNLADIYNNEGKYTEALDNMFQSLKIVEEIGDKHGMSSTLGDIGGIYGELADSAAAKGNLKFAEEKHAIAQKYEFEALQLDEEMGSKFELSYDYENIGANFILQKKYVLAKQYLDSALTESKSIGNKDALENVYQNRAILDSSTSNFKAALADYKMHIIYCDSLKNEENTKKLVKEQMQYDFDKKQAEEKAEQDKKDAVAAADKRKQQFITASVSLGLLLVLAFSGLLFNRFRIAHRQKKIIEEQKKAVEEKNKEVLDSITYAKRLQDAILPPLSLIKKYLPESFLMYKPKDIVAGDFYWMERMDDIILIAACDCTGHGVPGAMVSVVCSNALNRALKEFKIRDTGKLLDKVRELVLETFEKSQGDVKDGMDCSLCAINTKTNEVEWSGAYNPLWYVQNGEMKELSPDKQPIGKHDKSKSFSTTMLNLQKGDTLYLFTDGYADQFGGPKGKKFKYKAMQEKLLAISHQPMSEQGKILEDTLEKWKGELEQVDDILIIGIRV